MDERQASIVFQSSLKVALDIIKHNADLRAGERLLTDSHPARIDPKDVVDLALKLSRVAYDPRPHMKKQEETSKK